MRAESLETRVVNRIARKRGDVFLREDFRDLGGYDQVGRVLRGLVRSGQLLKVGYGDIHPGRKIAFQRQARAAERTGHPDRSVEAPRGRDHNHPA